MDTADKRLPPDPPPRGRKRPAGSEAEAARAQELLDTRYMADLGPVEPGWGRRQFLFLSSVATGFAGLNFFVWPFIDSLNPAADVQALASTEVDLAPIEEGQSITVVWRGKPIFIRHRTQAEIAAAKAGDGADLPDPASDAERAPK
ncbi:MAG TPA: ubiquinol-cytochrome c reductase iron-sulfur subunit N-terminal domain-containing protein, partial [Rhodospirillales bacterium]|nr:ubiquinol-cytochrome c reductase iron-sulfur subunit N-terminal domain-containing protein [Rhodospirillales bacterium]